MARVYDSILAGTLGRVGRLVVVNRQGMEYIRLQPRRRTAPPSPKQQLVQQRMKLALAFMNSYKEYACKHFGARVGHKNQYNRAVNNVLNSLLMDYDAHTITPNYPTIAFSKGDLLPIVEVAMTKTDAATLHLTWQDNSGSNPDRQTDQLQILIAPEGEYQTYFMRNVAPRSAQSYTITLPAPFQNKILHFYFAFQSIDQTQVSDSMYAGSIP